MVQKIAILSLEKAISKYGKVVAVTGNDTIFHAGQPKLGFEGERSCQRVLAERDIHQKGESIRVMDETGRYLF